MHSLICKLRMNTHISVKYPKTVNSVYIVHNLILRDMHFKLNTFMVTKQIFMKKNLCAWCVCSRSTKFAFRHQNSITLTRKQHIA